MKLRTSNFSIGSCLQHVKHVDTMLKIFRRRSHLSLLNLCVYVSVNTSLSSNHISTRFETFFYLKRITATSILGLGSLGSLCLLFNLGFSLLRCRHYFTFGLKEREKKGRGVCKGGDQVSEKKFQMDEL